MKIVILLLTCTLASGCMTKRYYPVPVHEDTAQLTLIMTDDAGAITHGLAPAATSTLAEKQMQAYATWYLHMSSQIKLDEYRHDDMSLGFGILGLAAGALKSVEGAGIGALLASGAKLPVTRYQMVVQSKNYENASDAMYCMFSHLTTLEDGYIPDTAFLNERIYEVRRKLRIAQMQITLATPDQQDLKAKITAALQESGPAQQAIRDADAAEQIASEQQANFATQAPSLNNTQRQSMQLAQSQVNAAAVQAKVRAIKLAKAQAEKELAACIATFSS